MNSSQLLRAKKRIYEILEPAERDDLPSRVFDISILTLVALNVTAVILESVKALSETYSGFFALFEVLSVAVFTAEYLLRIWACTADPEYQSPIRGRLRYMGKALLLIDAVAILPFYVGLFAVTGVDLRFIRALRLFRLFRIFKAGRYNKALTLIVNVCYARKAELVMGATVLGVLLLFASSMMYMVEGKAQPEAFSSIPASMWWGVATLTTVGYGDVYPVTTLGKALSSVIAILGIGVFALPAGILASGFGEQIRKALGERAEETKSKFCPHCGKRLED